MDISIVIVNYKVKEYIVTLINSIYKYSKSNIDFEIIIVDNNSNDGSVEYIKNKFDKIILIENQVNFGFSYGVNQGASIARGEFMLILNPDTLFVEDTLKSLIDISLKFKIFGAIGPKITFENGATQKSFWRFPTLLNTVLSLLRLDFLNLKKNYFKNKFKNITSVDSISGAAFFVPRELFISVDGFDENLFWMEDIDYCYRVKEKGYKVFFYPKTRIIHLKGKSSEKNFKVSISNQLISKIKYFNIHHKRLSALIIFYFVIIISIFKSMLLIPLIPFSRIYKKKFFAYLFTIRKIIFD